MSNLLNESIVDAKALRDSALRNAETAVIEKYSDEVKKTLENLLEQDELDLGMEPAIEETPDTGSEEVVEEESEEVPLAATDGLAENDGDNLHNLHAEGEEVQVTLDLGALQEAIEAMSAEIDEEIDIDITEDATEEVTEEASCAEEAEEVTEEVTEEQIDIDSIVDSVVEQLTVDMGAEISGWAGRPTSELKYEQDRELAKEASTVDEDEVVLDEEEEQTLSESVSKLDNVLVENKNLKEQMVNYQSAIEEIKENLFEVNLSNARLLYTNRVLRNSSLNERQKDKIVEAISSAGSVMEAKTIFETLQSTVEAKPKHRPQSLSEAINSRPSMLTASRKETKTSSQDPFATRMRRLAGIK